MTITEIRAMFPNPVPAPNCVTTTNLYTTYCVGGSLCLAMVQHLGHQPHSQNSWPGYKYLAGVLQEYNHALDYDTAYEYAWKIITDNDNDMIESAWALAEQALAYREED